MVSNAVIGAEISNADTGLIKGINVVFAPLEGLSPIMFYIVLILLYGLVTQFVHNVVLLAVFTPVALQFGTLVGANPITVTFIGIVILSTAQPLAPAPAVAWSLPIQNGSRQNGHTSLVFSAS